ncbi:MAG TPA: biosynthetic peptidoglycan transglycosylase [Kofleriaceae bacterium]|nr:biosynthetic peptidoglycan transglycosylase [Kofleriaceae bacterium]
MFATLACAVGVPVTASAWLATRTATLAEHLGAAGGGRARIGRVDADLTGTIRLSDIAFGDLVAAEAIEASITLDSLLTGALRADEIRVTGPRVAIQVDGHGDSDLARLAHRLLVRRRDAGDRSPGPGRLRRIVVSGGALSAHVVGVGDLVADGVELVPDAGGVRVLTGAVRIDGHPGPLGVELGFARSATQLTLPEMRPVRMLAVGGTGRIAMEDAPGSPGATVHHARLHDVAVGRLAAGGMLELRATVDDDGIPRPLAIEVKLGERAITIHGDRIPLGTLAPLAPHGVALDRAHATGSVAVRRDAARLLLAIDGTVEGVWIDHPVLAPAPVPLAAAMHAAIAISPDAITVSRAAVELGAARWTATGWLRRGAPASSQLDVSLAPAACGDLLASLPAELRGPLDGMVLTGSLGGRMRLAIDLAAPAGEGVDLTTSITQDCRTEVEPPAADVTRLAASAGHGVAGDSHTRTAKGEPSWVALPKLPAHVPGAFISAEDARFYDHPGFDLRQIAKSLEIDLREHRLVRGGSTISQQLVKNAFLPPRRSFDRKLQEAILTWRLETRLDKQQILERYLNVIELGPHVFGLAAAAKHWFDVPPRALSVRQAAFLAALTSEPTSMARRVRHAGGLDPDSAARVDVVLRAMRRGGTLTQEQLEAAKSAPLGFAHAALTQER